MAKTIRVATDVGGTFTDLVAFETDLETGISTITTAKSDTTPPNFEIGVLNVLKKGNVELSAVDFLAHGTTVVINALTERKGVKVGLLATEGFRDTLEIARGNRPDFFNLHYEKPKPFVPRYLRRELPGRITYKGEELKPLDLSGLPAILDDFKADGVEAVAICFLHSYANTSHEQRTREAVQDDARHGFCHSDRLFPELSRSGRSTADAGPGLHGRRWRQIPAGFLVAHRLPGPRHPDRRLRLQPARRRAAGPAGSRTMSVPTLSIENLTLGFAGHKGLVEVLHGISLHIQRGERVALVGESGSGKSVTAMLILGLLQDLKTARVAGTMRFEGEDLARLEPKERHALRGTKMSMIFQDPTSSLNPVFKIGAQFHEVLRRRDPRIKHQAARQLAIKALADVAIGDPERALDSYSFQLSGGMNQRVMIAMALCNEPSLLIADEPGTALDVTVQAQTLGLMRDLVEQHQTSVLFISHNLGVVREFADRVYVIYKGNIVEQGPATGLFDNPQHPYTKALLRAVPRITGGGIPEIDDASADYLQPRYVHPGFAEPEAVR